MTETRGRRSGGRAARQAARLHAVAEKVPFITRTLTPFEVLSEEGLALIEENADTILEQVGIDFRDAADALELFRGAGADVDGERVRFPRGLVPPARAGDRPADVHAGGAQPGAQRRRSAARTRSSRPLTARRSCAISTAAAATGRSRTSATS